MIALIRGEMIKVRTTRTALGFASHDRSLLTLLRGAAELPRRRSRRRSRTSATALNVGALPLAIPLLLFGIVGATGEYRHRTTGAGRC